jgi:hypothetical protein
MRAGRLGCLSTGAHMFKITVVTLALMGTLSAGAMFGGEHVGSGYVGPASMNHDQVARLLNEQGYTDVMGLHKSGTIHTK